MNRTKLNWKILGVLFGLMLFGQVGALELSFPDFGSLTSLSLNDLAVRFQEVTVDNSFDSRSYEGYFTISVYHDDDEIAYLRTNYVTIPSGERLLVSQLDISFVDFWVDQDFREVVLRTNRFPAGRYRLEVTFTYEDGDVFCETDFDIINPPAPITLYPSDGEIVLDPRPNFVWTQVLDFGSTFSVNYLIEVFEMDVHQSVEEAVQRIPIWKAKVENSTSVRYPPEAPPLKAGKKYVWRVKAFDEHGFPVGENMGESEPTIFEMAEDLSSTFSQQEAIRLLLQKTLDVQSPKSRIFLLSQPLEIGDVVGTPSNPYEIEIHSRSWLGWVDTQPDRDLPHKIVFVIIDAITGEAMILTNKWTPLVNGCKLSDEDLILVKEGVAQ